MYPQEVMYSAEITEIFDPLSLCVPVSVKVKIFSIFIVPKAGLG